MSKKSFFVKAIIFDMDGVITNTMPDHYKAWHVVLMRHGVKANHHDIYSREGQKGLQSVEEIFARYGKAFNRPLGFKILKEKERLFKKIVKRRFIVGSRSFIKQMHEKGFVLGLVTGTARHELNRILPKNIYSLFKTIVTGSDVHNGKPHPEPFMRCLRQLNLKANDAIVIENAPLGIASAKAAGLKCLALQTSLTSRFLKNADGIYKTINEMQQKVNFQKS